MNSTSADIYEIAMGRWSRRLSRSFLDFVAVPTSDSVSAGSLASGSLACSSLIDVGCGTGSLTLAAATRYPDAKIIGIDLMPDYLTEALRNTAPNAEFETGDAAALPFGDDSFDTAFSQLLLNDLDGPARAVSEMVRVTRPSGRIAATVWDRAGGLTFIRLFLDVAAILVHGAGEELRKKVFDVPYQNEDALFDLWSDAGLHDVDTTTIAVRMDFLDFEDYWQSLMGAHSLIREFFGNLSPELAHEVQQATMRAFLAGQADGRRSLVASALAVRGVVPGTA